MKWNILRMWNNALRALWNLMLRIKWNKINPYAPQRISHGAAIFHTRSVFHKSRKGFISLRQNKKPPKGWFCFGAVGGRIPLVEVQAPPLHGGSTRGEGMTPSYSIVFFCAKKRDTKHEKWTTSNRKQKKRQPSKTVAFWRRRRDLNPRAAFDRLLP